MNELDGANIFGNEIKIGWGKAIPRNPMTNPQMHALSINQVAPGLTETARSLILNPNLVKIRIEPPRNESIRAIIDCVSRI